MAITSVPMFHALGIWSVALERQFGWSRTQLSFAFVFTRIEGGIMGPVEGYLTDRLGTRRMVLIGMSILGMGFLLFGRVENLWMFYLAFIVMALGQGLGGWLPIMTLLNNWFVRRRSTAIGWANVGSRGGALFLVPAIAWAVDPEADRLGWPLTATILGAFILLVAFPVTRLIRNRPEEYGLIPDGNPATAEGPAADTGPVRLEPGQVQQAEFTASQAIRTPAFWCITLGHGLMSMLIVTVMGHLALMLTDQGLSLQTAAWVLTVYTATSMVFQIVGGYVGDRLPKNVAIFVFSTIQGGSVLAITLAHSVPMAVLFAVAFGIGMGGRNTLVVAIRGDYFGRKAFGSIMGLSLLPMNVFLLIAPLLTGVYRDAHGEGGYILPFNLLGAFCFVGGFLFLLAKKPSPPPRPTRS